jgi:hypothetical protein
VKKIFSLVLTMLILIPFNVHARVVGTNSGGAYGTITVEEPDSGWSGSEATGFSVTQTYTITKSKSEYLYFTLLPTNNVSDLVVLASSGFSTVVNVKNSDGSVSIILKTNNDQPVSSKTEIFTVTAKIVDPSKKECKIDYMPGSLQCLELNGNYFDKNGKKITETEYKEICEGYVPDDPTDPDEPLPPDIPENPKSGSVIPYVAVGGGLIAIAGLYLFSRKSNKMYRL